MIFRNLFAALLLGGGLSAFAAEAPFEWIPPRNFSLEKGDWGLEQLPGVRKTLLFSPLPSEAPGGRYESPRHGLYNHTPAFILKDGFCLVYWVNHMIDENGPGTRVLARIGRIDEQRGTIQWQPGEKIFELIPPAGTVAPRPLDYTASRIDGFAATGHVSVIGDRLFVFSYINSCLGWVDDMKFHNWNFRGTAPDRNYFRNYRKGLLDRYHRISDYVQEWKFTGDALAAVSPLYALNAFPEEVKISESFTQQVAKPAEPYASALPLAQAPEEFRKVIRQPGEVFLRNPNYAPGTWHLAANGINGLAHFSEFERPDGTLVVVRDNLKDRSCYYYAAEKAAAAEFYPAAEKTALPGTSMPVAGTTAGGVCWIVGNNGPRTLMFITWSKGGRKFDRTAKVEYLARQVTPGGLKPAVSGPQYFKAVPWRDRIWIICSIAREEIAFLDIPVRSLE